MAVRKPYCIGDCDFKGYYNQQIGSGFGDIRYFRGRPYQRGYGFSSLLRRFGAPIVKYLAGQAISATKEFVAKPEVQQVLKQESKKLAKRGVSKIIKMIDEDQAGTGIGKRKRRAKRKKRLYKPRKTAKKKITRKRRVKKRSKRRTRRKAVKDIFG